MSSFDGSIVVQTLSADAPARRIGTHEGPTQELVWSNDLRRLCSSSQDGQLILWDVATGNKLSTLHGMRPRFSPDGTALAFLGDEKIVVVQSSDGSPRYETPLAGSPLLRVEYSPEGEWLLCGAEDGTATLLAAPTGAPLRQFDLEEALWQSGFGGGGKTVFAANVNGVLRAWDTETGALLAFFEGPISSMEAAAMGPTGRYLVTGGRDGATRIWDLESSPARLILRTENVELNEVLASPLGDHLATVSGNDVVSFYRTGERIPYIAFTAQTHVSPVKATFAADGHHALASLDAFTVVLMDLEAQRVTKRLEQLAAPAQTLDYADGALITSNHEIVWWNPDAEDEAIHSENTFGQIRAAALRPAGATTPTAALGGVFPGIVFYDPIAGKEVRRIPLDGLHAQHLRYARDSRMLAASTEEGDLYFLDPVSGAIIRHFPAEGSSISRAEFLPGDDIFAQSSRSRFASIKALHGPETAITLNTIRGTTGMAVAAKTQQVCIAGGSGELMLVPGMPADYDSVPPPVAATTTTTPLVVLITPERLAALAARVAQLVAPETNGDSSAILRVGEAIPTVDVLPLGLRAGDRVLAADSSLLSLPAVAGAIARLGTAQQLPGNSLRIQRGGLRFDLRVQTMEQHSIDARIALSPDEAIEALEFARGTLIVNRMSFTMVQADDARDWGTSNNVQESVPISIPPPQNDGYVALYKKLGIATAMRLQQVNGAAPPPVAALGDLLVAAQAQIKAGWKGSMRVTLQLGGLGQKNIEYVVQ